MMTLMIVVGAWALYFFGFYYGKYVGRRQGMREARRMIDELQNAYCESEASK